MRSVRKVFAQVAEVLTKELGAGWLVTLGTDIHTDTSRNAPTPDAWLVETDNLVAWILADELAPQVYEKYFIPNRRFYYGAELEQIKTAIDDEMRGQVGRAPSGRTFEFESLFHEWATAVNLPMHARLAHYQRIRHVIEGLIYPDLLPAGERYGFLVGINRFDSEIPDLESACADAERLGEILLDPSIGKLPAGRLLVLKDATRSEFNSNMRKLFSKLMIHDTLILFVGSHGCVDVDISGFEPDGFNKFIAFRDTDPSNCFDTAIYIADLGDIIAKAPCRNVLFLLDLCFAGQAGMSVGRKARSYHRSATSWRSRPLSYDSAFMRYSSAGRSIITACRANELAFEVTGLESDGAGTGIFSYCVRKAMRGDARTNPFEAVTAANLLSYVEAEVPRVATLFGCSQTPTGVLVSDSALMLVPARNEAPPTS